MKTSTEVSDARLKSVWQIFRELSQQIDSINTLKILKSK